MNIRSDSSSPWGKRVFYGTAEFEAMMDEAMLRAGADVFVEGQGVNVDRVLFKGFGVEADYADLGEGLLGRTIFHADGTAHVEVSRELAEEAEVDTVARRRLRSTLGHEGGHLACHGQLFVTDTGTISMFPESAEEPKPSILCRSTSVGTTGYSGEWWEYQANQCMACLLLPRRLLRKQYAAVLESVGVRDFVEAVKHDVEEEVIRGLAAAPTAIGRVEHRRPPQRPSVSWSLRSAFCRGGRSSARWEHRPSTPTARPQEEERAALPVAVK